jgi:hypothetical protein
MHLKCWLGNSHSKTGREQGCFILWEADGTGSGLYPVADFGVCGFESLGPVTRVVVNQQKDSRFHRLKTMCLSLIVRQVLIIQILCFVNIIHHPVFI